MIIITRELEITAPPLRGQRLFINFSQNQKIKGDGYLLAKIFQKVVAAVIDFLIFSVFALVYVLKFFACGAKKGDG